MSLYQVKTPIYKPQTWEEKELAACGVKVIGNEQDKDEFKCLCCEREWSAEVESEPLNWICPNNCNKVIETGINLKEDALYGLSALVKLLAVFQGSLPHHPSEILMHMLPCIYWPKHPTNRTFRHELSWLYDYLDSVRPISDILPLPNIKKADKLSLLTARNLLVHLSKYANILDHH